MGDSPPARSPRPPKPCSCWPPKKCQTDRPAPQSHTQAQLPRGCPPLADENCSRPIRRPLFVARSYGIPEIICSGRQPLRPGDREQVNLQAFVSVSPPDELLHRRIGTATTAEQVAFFGNLPMLPDVIRGPIRNIPCRPAVGIIAGHRAHGGLGGRRRIAIAPECVLTAAATALRPFAVVVTLFIQCNQDNCSAGN